MSKDIVEEVITTETDKEMKQRHGEGEKEETVEKETVENIVSLNLSLYLVVFKIVSKPNISTLS